MTFSEMFCLSRKVSIAVNILLLQWPFCYCCGMFVTAVRFLLLMWHCCYRCEIFAITVAFLLLL